MSDAKAKEEEKESTTGSDMHCRWHIKKRICVCNENVAEEQVHCKYWRKASKHVPQPEYCAYWRRGQEWSFNGWTKCSHYLAQQNAMSSGRYHVNQEVKG